MPNDDAAMPPDSDPSFVDAVDWSTVERYVAGEGTVAGRLALEAWIAGGAPDRLRLVEAVRAFRTAARAARPRFDTNTAWTAAQARIGQGTAPPSPSSPLASALRVTRRNPHLWPRGVGGRAGRTMRRQLSAVAAWAIAACAAVAVITLSRSRFSPGPAWREYVTSPGQRQTVTLTDGTQLTLAPASALRVPVDYGAGHRALSLSGEAFFSVVHDDWHPFAVRAADAEVTDIGTRFDVRAYADDRGVRVAVQEGRVSLDAVVPRAARRVPSVRTPESSAALSANDVAVLDSSGRITIRHGVTVDGLLNWRQGGLAFDHTPLRDAIKDLGRAFDLRITVADSTLLDHVITASFDEAPLDDVLDAITFAMGARYERAGRRVVILRRIAGTDRSAPAPSPAALRTARAMDRHQ